MPFSLFGRAKNEVSQIFACNEYWLRLVTLLIYAGTDALRCIFHREGNFSKDPVRLYRELLSHKPYLINLKDSHKRKLLYPEQIELLFSRDQKTYSERFDITLLVILIQHVTSISPPVGGWVAVKKLQPNDTSLASYILKLRKLRNDIFHKQTIVFQEFLEYWSQAILYLQCLNYDTKRVEQLKSGKLTNLETFQIATIQSKILHLHKSLESLSKKITENEKCSYNLHLQLGVLTENVNVIEESVGEVSSSIVNLQISSAEQEQNVKSLKTELQGVLRITDEINTTLDKAKFDYQISLKQTSDVLERMISTGLNDLEKRIATLEDLVQDYDKDFPASTLVERLDKASSVLKDILSTNYENECLQNPFSIEHCKDTIFVDLVIAKHEETVEDFQIIDKEHHIKTQLDRPNSVELKDIVDFKNDVLVLLRGSAGIGKSVLTKHLTYLWSTCKIWPEIELLFYFSCRDLNAQTSTRRTNLREILKDQYSSIFQHITFNEIGGISNKVCVIIDGMDEFVGITEFRYLYAGSQNNDLLPITNCIYKILSHTEDALRKSSVLVSGRPSACSVLTDCLKVKKKVVDILGFNANNVDRYVEAFFNDNKDMISLVKETISCNLNLELMTRIPIYLWVICSLYKAKEVFSVPNTSTELYVLELLLFMKNHFRNGDQNFTHKSLSDMARDDNVCKAILDLSKIAHIMLDKVILESKDLESLETLETLNSIGMLKEISNVGGKRYQFCHLSMQEFLAAIFVTFNGFSLNDLYFRPNQQKRQITRLESDKKFRGALPFIFGLQGSEMISIEDNYLPQILMHNLRKQCTGVRKASFLSINNLYRRVNMKAQNTICNANSEFALFFGCYYEYQYKLERDDWLKNKQKLQNGGLKLHFCPQFPIHAKHFSYFLQKEIKFVREISIKSVHHHSFLFQANKNDSEKKKLLKDLLSVNTLRLDEKMLRQFPLTNVNIPTLSTAKSYQDGDWMKMRTDLPMSVQPQHCFPRSGDMILLEEIQLKTLEIRFTECAEEFDKKWISIPKTLILDLAFSLDSFKKTLDSWRLHIQYQNLDALHVNVNSLNNSAGQVFSTLHIFKNVPKIVMKFSSWDLEGVSECWAFAADLSTFFQPSGNNLEMLEIVLKDSKHVYVNTDGNVKCTRCIDKRRNIRSPQMYDLNDFAIEQNTNSSPGSINSDDGNSAILETEGPSACCRCC